MALQTDGIHGDGEKTELHDLIKMRHVEKKFSVVMASAWMRDIGSKVETTIKP